ncbi:HupE/UreJ family protein [Consotaella aegiceratis]|uniref:HupE/UreJ family protein n=1 Tax=Consotaella aegiceratis TaxID=3097961 RepID=UPI002F409486
MITGILVRVLQVLGIALACLVCVTAQAHPIPESTLALRVEKDRVEANLTIPLSEFRLAFDLADPVTEAGIDARSGQIANYLVRHIVVTSLDGTDGDASWAVEAQNIRLDRGETAEGAYAEIAARLAFRSPDGEIGPFRLSYDAVLHKVVTHRILVSLTQEEGDGLGRQIGIISAAPKDGSVAPLIVTPETSANNFTSMLRLGMSHIAEGTDHLLFLLVLLLPAPLIAVAGRWRDQAPGRCALWTIAKVVTAFTIGHSLSLAVAVLLHLDIPQAPIEVLIALTVLMGSLHAIRPLFPGKEAWVAGLFGVVHGLAFSFTLARLDLSSLQLALSLLGFNLGVEIVQLAIVVATMPFLLVLARVPGYRALRLGGATVTGLAAIGWTAARMGQNNPLAEIGDGIGAVGVYIWVALVMVALFSLFAGPGRKARSGIAG